MKKEFIASESGGLIKLIQDQFPQINYAQIKTALRKKDVKVNFKRISKEVEVRVGDNIQMFLPEEKPKNIPVVFEDENVLIVFKPQGLEVTKKDKTYDSKCLEELTNATAMHRLDKNTEGLVVMSKNAMATNEITRAFKEKLVHKKYLAVCTGNVKSHANLVAYLKKDSNKNIVTVFDYPEKNSVQIKTNYVLLSSFNDLFIIEVELLTGKTHQIRAHLKHENIYILGDEKYGDKKVNAKYREKKQCLCAYKLQFEFDKSSPLFYLNSKNFQVAPTFKNFTFFEK